MFGKAREYSKCIQICLHLKRWFKLENKFSILNILKKLLYLGFCKECKK